MAKLEAMIFINTLLQFERFRTLAAYNRRRWQDMPIRETNEPLVEMSPSLCFPYYAHKMHLTADPRIFLREQVAERFTVAARIVAHYGYELRIYDGWRSLAVQEGIFWTYLKQYIVHQCGHHSTFAKAETAQEVKECFESLGPELQKVLREATEVYASWPSADLRCPSPHATGGSVDVWLYQDGHPVDMGVPFDHMEEEAGAFYHLSLPKKSMFPYRSLVSQRRSILLYAMVKAGFVSYAPEFWHFSYGNQMASVLTRKVASYSYIEP